MLRIRLFGSGRANFHGAPLVGFPRQQPYMLLCYLLLNKKYPLQREHLAAVIWGDCPSESARKYLRNALWRLRGKFKGVGAQIEDFILITDDTISFNHSSDYWLDIEEFETRTTHFQDVPVERMSLESVSELEMAVELYEGDLLGSIYEDWCLYDRERLRLGHLNALYKLMGFHGLQGNYDRGLDCGERLLALDRTREKVHRQMMWLYTMAGDRSAALVQYQRCNQILRQDLDIHPMQETQDLYNKIIHYPAELESLPDPTTFPPPGPRENFNSTKHLVDSALKKLGMLQSMINDTSTELQVLEKMISRAFPHSE
ncbi:MAG TPA: BTAD domain-containing putative transcriptional regulator [Anaerolineales bacterium]|nr:BTAD domain-containing putative transcriptional regulator [Anaerolineales bacterium]